MNTIQGNNVILSIMKDDWVQHLCATDMSLNMSLDTLENKTVGDGHWASFAHDKLSYTVNLSGLSIMNDTDDQTNFSDFDTANHWIKSLYLQFRMSFYDDAGDIKSFQGYALVTGITFNVSSGQLVKGDATLLGTGDLLFFDGLIPCDSAVFNVAFSGETDPDGNVDVTYSYTGSIYQVKYRVDGSGAWIDVLAGETIHLLGVDVGSHSIEIIPVCANGYEGEGSTEGFDVTHALTCSSVFDAITFNPGSTDPISAAPHTSAGTPTQYKFRIDGGSYTTVPIAYVVSLAGQTVGSHTIDMTPICSNGVEGTGTSDSFTVNTNPAQSIIDWQLASFTTGNTLNIYVNGILTMGTSTPGTGSITVATGDSIRGELMANNNTGSTGTLRTQDITLSTILDTRNGTAPTVLAYIFTANGDEFSILGTVTP